MKKISISLIIGFYLFSGCNGNLNEKELTIAQNNAINNI